MRKTIVVATLLTLVFVPVFSASAQDKTIPFTDYEKLADQTYKGECDFGKTKGTVYRLQGSNILDINELPSGEYAYRFRDLETGEVYYFWKDIGATKSPYEVTKNQWLEKTKKVAPNFYNAITGKSGHDCHVIK